MKNIILLLKLNLKIAKIFLKKYTNIKICQKIKIQTMKIKILLGILLKLSYNF